MALEIRKGDMSKIQYHQGEQQMDAVLAALQQSGRG
jgi:hypothetical protein